MQDNYCCFCGAIVTDLYPVLSRTEVFTCESEECLVQHKEYHKEVASLPQFTAWEYSE